MRKRIALIGFGLVLATAPAVAPHAWAADTMPAPNPQSKLNGQDQMFLKKAGPGDAAEMDLGKIASQKAQSPAVKEFGAWMSSAHGTSLEMLNGVAQKVGGAPAPTALTDEQKAEATKLEGLSGKQFDQAYIQGMVKDHEKDIQLYQGEAQAGQNPVLMKFAQNTLPVLNQHLTEAKKLEAHEQATTGKP